MKFRTFIIPLVAAAGLALVLGLGFWGGLWLRSPLSLLDKGEQRLPVALQFVPKQSPLVVSVLTRPDRLTDLWEYLADPSLRQSVQTDIQTLERSLLAPTGLTYKTDIQPWLGEEVTVALVSRDLDQNGENGYFPGYLVAFACQDSQAARSQLELFWQNRAIAGAALTFEDFSGSRLIYAQSRSAPPDTQGQREQWATALVADRLLLMANHPDVLRQALTAAQAADANLQTEPRYKAALSALPTSRLGLAIVNLPAVASWLNQDEPAGSPRAIATALAQLTANAGAADWGVFSLRLTRQGLLADMALVAPQGQRLAPVSPTPKDWGAMARYLPDSLAMAVLGTDLATFTDDLPPLFNLGSTAGTPWLSPTRAIDRTFGPGAAEALLTGIDQDYALGVKTLSAGELTDWVLLSPQAASMDQALNTLTELARQQGLGVGTLELQGEPATVWTRLSLSPRGGSRGAGQPLTITAEVAGLQAQVGRYGAIATSADIIDGMLGLRQASLQYPDWWSQTEQFQRPSAGYIYLDWPQLQASLGQRQSRFRLWEAAAQPALKHLRQITMARYGQTEQVQTGAIFVQLSNS
jgi:hypothetical protein